MKQIDFFDLFNRNSTKDEIQKFLMNFDVKDTSTSKGIYVIGPVGCGKTEFIKSIIKELKYDMVLYDASNSRTKNTINSIMGSKISNCNVVNMFYKSKKKIVVVMDEMDYMNGGDKGGLKEMIKYTRAKKTKKQITEPQTTSPIIYIGTNDNDKKIKELATICHVIRLEYPSNTEVKEYLKVKMPNLESDTIIETLSSYSNGNLHKLKQFIDFYNNETTTIEDLQIFIDSITHKYNQNMYTKFIVKELYNRYIPISEYTEIVKETDRTTLGLLWHENLSEIMNYSNENNLGLYKNLLDNLCISDYNDRIIFQNQIWQLSEQNSFIKIFYNNYLLHKFKENIQVPEEIIFTKVLTKYSTEYNNFLFLQQLEQKTFLDKKHILHLFLTKTEEELKEEFYLTTLDVERMKRFLKNGEFTCNGVSL
jgi:DNA polymerase III delta prime subunit